MASAADRFNINSQLEHLQSRYVGTGHADTNRFEWAVNIHRDSYAAYVGRPTMLQYFAVAENESIGRVRYNMMQVRDRPESRFVLDAWATVSTARSRDATPLGNCNPKSALSAPPFAENGAPLSAASAKLTPVPHVLRSTQKMLLPCGLPPEREEE
jgi:splicing factor 3B subunit 5